MSQKYITPLHVVKFNLLMKHYETLPLVFDM